MVTATETELQDVNSELWGGGGGGGGVKHLKGNYDFLSHNFDVCPHNCEFISHKADVSSKNWVYIFYINCEKIRSVRSKV